MLKRIDPMAEGLQEVNSVQASKPRCDSCGGRLQRRGKGRHGGGGRLGRRWRGGAGIDRASSAAPAAWCPGAASGMWVAGTAKSIRLSRQFRRKTEAAVKLEQSFLAGSSDIAVGIL